VLLMFNHGVITIGFFLIIGFIEKRRGSILIRTSRVFRSGTDHGRVFTVVMLASIGLPGLSGFVSEYLILIGTFATHSWWPSSPPLAWSPPRSICSGLPTGLPR